MTVCKVCGKPKRAPAKFQVGVSELSFDQDPYCSRACCEQDHGITDTKPGSNTSMALRPMVEPRSGKGKAA